jgi:hypothetical protein
MQHLINLLHCNMHLLQSVVISTGKSAYKPSYVLPRALCVGWTLISHSPQEVIPRNIEGAILHVHSE